MCCPYTGHLGKKGCFELTAAKEEPTQENLCLLPICPKAKTFTKPAFISTRGTKVGYRGQHYVLTGPRTAP